MVREKLRGFSRDVVVYGVGDGVGRLTGLIMLPILSRIFGPADYGAIELLTVGYAFALMFLRFGVLTGVQRHYYRSEGDARRHMVSSCLVCLVTIDAVGAGAIYVAAPLITATIGGPAAEVTASVRILAGALVVEQIWSYLVLLLRLQGRAVTFSIANIALVVLTPTFVYGLVAAQGAGLEGVFQAKLMALAIVTLGLSVLTRREFSSSVDVRIFARVLRFALPGHPALMIASVLNLVPRYLLAAFAPLAEVGLLGLAMRLGNVMRVAMEAFNRAWNPFAYANEGAPEERRVYEIVFKGLTCATLVIAATLSVFAPEILGVLTPSAYDGAWPLVPWVVISLGFDGVTRVFSTILYTRDRVAWSSQLAIGRLALFLAAGLVLVPRHGADGLVWTLAATSAMHAVVYALAAHRLFPFSLPAGRTLLAILLGASGVAGALALELALGPRLVLKLAVLVAIGFVSVALMLSREERARVRSLVRRTA